MPSSRSFSDTIEIGIVVLFVLLIIIAFIIQWISAQWSTILLIIEIIIPILIGISILYVIYYIKNYDEIQQKNQRLKEIRSQIRNSGIDYNEQKYYKNTNYSVRPRHISASVKNEVWERDGGKCVLCNSRHDLEWDHDIPFSRGGSNTAKNIRILCKDCNRKKSKRIE